MVNASKNHGERIQEQWRTQDVNYDERVQERWRTHTVWERW